VHKLPPGVDFKLAAAAGSYGTALHALRDVAKVQQGETVLVLGAAGGVGLAAVDLARLFGARVIACASTAEKLALCKSYGAAELVNYAAEDFRGALKKAAGDKGVDVAIDPVGGPYADTAVRSMGWGGRYVVIGFVGGAVPELALNLPLLKGCSVMGMSMMRLQKHDPQAAHAVSADVLQLLAEGKIRPHIHTGATYPLERTVDALKDLAGRRVLGKAVITNEP
jgi:NADPH2:quinone reductase